MFQLVAVWNEEGGMGRDEYPYMTWDNAQDAFNALAAAAEAVGKTDSELDDLARWYSRCYGDVGIFHTQVS